MGSTQMPLSTQRTYTHQKELLTNSRYSTSKTNTIINSSSSHIMEETNTSNSIIQTITTIITKMILIVVDTMEPILTGIEATLI